MKQYLALALSVLFVHSYAQDGVKDNAFGSSGIARTVLVAPNGATANSISDLTKIIVQNDGKILQVGWKSSSSGDDLIAIRYTKDGAADLSFGNTGAGWLVTDINNGNDRAHSVALQSDGKIIVVGEAVVSGKNVGVIVRYYTTGTPDPSFGTGGIVISDLFTGVSGINAVAIQPDGKIVVAGFASNGANNDFFIARYLSSGSIDGSFGAGGRTVLDFAAGTDAATDLKLMADGRMLLAGYARSGATDAFALARLTASGLPDVSFNGTGLLRTSVTGQGRSVVISPTGLIYFTGLSGNQFTTASYNANGTVNTAFGGTGLVQTSFGGNAYSRSVALQCDGKLVVGGESSYSYTVARYLPNGSLDPSFNGTGTAINNTGGGNRDFGYSGLAFQEGKILMGGISFTSASFYTRFHPTILRLNNASVSPVLIITNPAPVCAPATVDLTQPAVTAGSEAGLSYSYWTDTLATVALTNPTAVSSGGTYYIKGTTASGCYTIKPVQVTINPQPSGTVAPASSIICEGESQLLTATGGASYQWKRDGVDIPGATSANYSATIGGSYTVMIFSGGCSAMASNSATVSVEPLPSGTITPSSATICQGGFQTLMVGGGKSYQWKKDGVDISGANAGTYNATESGTYTVTIFSNSCSALASNSSVITVTPTPTGSISPASASICPGGSQVLTATGGTSYQWKKDGVDIGGATSATYTATTAGTYTATIFNGSCSGPASNSSVITVSSAPSGSISPASGSICSGGSITLTVTGGTSYQWKKDGVDIPGATSATYDATSAGTYTATIINGSCSGPASNSSVITVSSSPSGSISPASGSICSGGSITLTVTGGTSYQWKKDGVDIPGATSATYDATSAGTYTATIINGSCSGPASNSSVITVSSSPTGSISPASGSICPGGSLTLTVTGGTSYQWKKDGVDIPGATSATYDATSAGTYTATIINGSCSGPASNSSVITVSSSPSGSISPASGSICSGGSITLTVTGGTSYQWKKDGVDIPGATSATYDATSAGTYTATIINGSCSGPASNSSVITVSSAPSGSISPASGSICPGGSLTLTVTGGTSYQWKKDGVDIPGATSATYDATSAGTYTATIINGSCSGPASNSSVITVSSSPSGSISPASGSICPGGSLTLTVTGGTSYQWKKDGVDISGATAATYDATSAGTYTATIINGSCSGPASNSSVITVSSTPTGSISPASGSICPGGSLTLTVTGGTSYQWKKDGVDIPGANSATYNAISAGTYTATIINGSCSGPASNSSVITTGTSPAGNITPKSATICAGSTATLTASGGSSYQWRLNGADITGETNSTMKASAPGAYTVMIFNGSCSGLSADTAIVSLSPTPSGSITPASATICEGGVQELQVTGGTSYQWYRNGVLIGGATADSLLVTQQGNYSVMIFANACAGPASNTVDVDVNKPTGQISPASGSICPGESINLTASGGSSYQWMRNGADIPGATGATYAAAQAGNYQVKIFSGNCMGLSDNSVQVTAAPLPAGSISPALDSICEGESITLRATGGSSYQWQLDGINIPGAVSDTLHASQPGRYTVIIFNGSCSAPASNAALLTGRLRPKGITVTFNVRRNSPYPLEARPGLSYQWSPANGLSDPNSARPIVTVAADAVYFVRIGQSIGCPVTDTVNVRVFNETQVYVPNAFTPNGDGKNDVLRPVPVHIREIKYFRVMNRWGEVVFETNRIGEGWNGIYKGKPQPNGVFVWIFDGVDVDGKRILVKGTSVLIR